MEGSNSVVHGQRVGIGHWFMSSSHTEAAYALDIDGLLPLRRAGSVTHTLILFLASLCCHFNIQNMIFRDTCTSFLLCAVVDESWP